MWLKGGKKVVIVDFADVPVEIALLRTGLQNTYFTFFEFATFFRFLSLDLRFFLKKRTVNRQTLNRS